MTYHGTISVVTPGQGILLWDSLHKDLPEVHNAMGQFL